MILKTDLPGNLHTTLAHLTTKSYTDGEERAWCWRRLGPVFMDHSEHMRPRVSAAPDTEPNN